MELTIIIPTKNRTEFLKRQLIYFEKTNFKGVLLYGDASDSDIYRDNVNLIRKYSSNLNIKHYHDTEKSSEQVTIDLIEKVSTNYVSLLPDDDLILTSAALDCINFLDANNDYVAAHGKAYEMTINYGKNDPFGKFTGLTAYPMVKTDEDSAVKRVKTFFKKVTNINMAIIRTSVSRDAYRSCSDLDYYFSSLIFGELTHGTYLLSKGKIKELNCDYLVRQVHNNQFFDKMNLLDWFSKPNWCKSYSVLKKVISQDVLNKESDSYACDKKEVDLFISEYFKNLLVAANKANKLHNMKKNIFFNKFFTLYRHFKLLRQGQVKVEKNKSVKDYISIIEKS